MTAQLIEAASGSHISSERYDRPVDDLFAVRTMYAKNHQTTETGGRTQLEAGSSFTVTNSFLVSRWCVSR